MDKGRWHDMNQLHRDLARARDPHERRQIERSIDLIKQETGAHRSMRERLIRAHQNQDWDEVRDIQEYVESHEKYKRFGE